MRINTNVASLNAYKNLQGVQGSIAKSMEKLSSGLRINNAADDAAGMGISNKMRADIRALNQAGRNAEQANSLAQIAEGGVQSIQKILERMKELATQSASDTVDAGGRSRIQAEFGKIREEITRIVDSTNFQGSELLDGTFGNTLNATAATNVGGVSTVSASAATGTYELSSDGTDVFTLTKGLESQTIDLNGATGASTLDFSAFGIQVELSDIATAAAGVGLAGAGKDIVVGAGSGNFMVGSTGQYAVGDADNIQLGTMDLTLSTLGIGTSDLSTADGARTALTAIDSAIGTVSSTLGEIGAFQNRLSFAQDNLKSAVNNLSAADSVVRDLDIAAEMTSFSKNNILSQAGTAMLAQANQMGQGVLQLLRG